MLLCPPRFLGFRLSVCWFSGHLSGPLSTFTYMHTETRGEQTPLCCARTTDELELWNVSTHTDLAPSLTCCALSHPQGNTNT